MLIFLQSRIDGGGNNQGAGKSLKYNSLGVTINGGGGLVKCPRKTASCIPANILKWFCANSKSR